MFCLLCNFACTVAAGGMDNISSGFIVVTCEEKNYLGPGGTISIFYNMIPRLQVVNIV